MPKVNSSGTEVNKSVPEQCQDLAGRVAAMIRVSVIDLFRQAVRQWASKQVEAEDERERREEERLKALRKGGVLYRDDSIPKKPGADWFFHLETLRGSITLPPEFSLPPEPPQRPKLPSCLRDQVPSERWSDADKNEVEAFRKSLAKVKEDEQGFWPQRAQAMLPIFEYVKQHGFPSHKEDGFLYEFEVCAWLPVELHYENDPPNRSLLPIPRRALSDVERMTILAAVCDAHWRGAEKIAPWGVSENGDEPDLWPSDAEQGERRAAVSYFMLFRQAENLNATDLTIAQCWLEEWKLPFQLFNLSSDTPLASAQDTPDPPPPPPAEQVLVFAPYGDGYFIRGFGAEGQFKSTVGLRRLEKLLCNAGRPVLMTALVSNGKSPQAVASLDQVIETDEDCESGFQDAVQQAVLDDDALKDIRKKLMALDDEIDKAKYNNDNAAIDRLTAEREQIKKHVNKDTRFGGKKSRSMQTSTDRLRSVIANSLSDAYKLLKKASPPLDNLSNHLKLAVRAEGPTYIYSPHPIPKWFFEKPSS